MLIISETKAATRTQAASVEVRKLASKQENHGNFLKSNALDMALGSYSFDLNTNTASYEFQFNVNSDDTNRSVQDKLAKLFNTANVSILAEVVDDASGRSALKLTSKQTGLGGNESYLFRITPATSKESLTTMDTLGISEITTPASNSSFLLNGQEHSSYANTFTINNTFEVHLKGISKEGSPATLGFKTNVDAVADNIQELVDSYNKVIQTANHYSDTPNASHKLLSDIGSVAHRFRDDFKQIGLLVQDDSTITIDRELLAGAIDTEDLDQSFEVLNQFKNALSAKANQASINPMQYVNKVVVEYKNPGRTFATPYITSVYSGMMLDKYL